MTILLRNSSSLRTHLHGLVYEETGVEVDWAEVQVIEQRIRSSQVPPSMQIPDSAIHTSHWTLREYALFYMLSVALGAEHNIDFGHVVNDDGEISEWYRPTSLPLSALSWRNHLVEVMRQVEELVGVLTDKLPLTKDHVGTMWRITMDRYYRKQTTQYAWAEKVLKKIVGGTEKLKELYSRDIIEHKEPEVRDMSGISFIVDPADPPYARVTGPDSLSVPSIDRDACPFSKNCSLEKCVCLPDEDDEPVPCEP